MVVCFDMKHGDLSHKRIVSSISINQNIKMSDLANNHGGLTVRDLSKNSRNYSPEKYVDMENNHG